MNYPNLSIKVSVKTWNLCVLTAEQVCYIRRKKLVIVSDEIHLTMAHFELDSFYLKFKNLLYGGKNATLNMKTENGRAFVTLSLDLGDVHGQDQLTKRSRNGPARQRRRDRRMAARSEQEQLVVHTQEDAENASDGINDVEETNYHYVAESADKTNHAEEASAVVSKNESIISSEMEEEKYSCCICDFTSKWENGLAIHMSRKHSNIEQLDGAADGTGQDMKYDRTSHYWKSGRIGITYQNYLEAIDVIETSDLESHDKEVEKLKVLEARKDAFGRNYKNFPPWN